MLDELLVLSVQVRSIVLEGLLLGFLDDLGDVLEPIACALYGPLVLLDFSEVSLHHLGVEVRGH